MSRETIRPYLITKDEEGIFRLTVRETRYNSQGYPLVTSHLQAEAFKTATAARNFARDIFKAEPGQYATKWCGEGQREKARFDRDLISETSFGFAWRTLPGVALHTGGTSHGKTLMLALAEGGTTIPVELIDTAELPDGGQLRLLRRGDDYSIRFGDNELMGNQVRHSEEALATLTCQRLVKPESRILIGGLGMGFTLRAALKSLPSAATITVAELIPEIVTWANGPLAHLFYDSLADPRLSIRMDDVHDVIVGDKAGFDAILLDVDNGPDGLIHLANERLYCNWGLRAAHAALRPEGVLAIWSAYGDDAFVARLENACFEVEEVSVPALVDGEEVTHTIWLAAKQEWGRTRLCLQAELPSQSFWEPGA